MGATEQVVVPVVQTQKVYVVVDGTGEASVGAFTLEVASRPVVCGDGFTDPPEECDDHNTNDGDGCSAECRGEWDETEPNDTVAQATPYSVQPSAARIFPAGDVDVFSIQVTAPNSMLFVETRDLGDAACANKTLDNRIDVIGPDGTTVLASNDDGGEGFCAKKDLSGLAPGTYYLRVEASGVATTFPYVLDMWKSP
jgi:cysteine-rich repeat protein